MSCDKKIGVLLLPVQPIGDETEPSIRILITAKVRPSARCEKKNARKSEHSYPRAVAFAFKTASQIEAHDHQSDPENGKYFDEEVN
jgi:hypothetical protein